MGRTVDLYREHDIELLPLIISGWLGHLQNYERQTEIDRLNWQLLKICETYKKDPVMRKLLHSYRRMKVKLWQLHEITWSLFKTTRDGIGEAMLEESRRRRLCIIDLVRDAPKVKEVPKIVLKYGCGPKKSR